MRMPRSFLRARLDGWLVPVLLMLLGLVPSVAGVARLTELSGNAVATPANARFIEAPLPVVVHILAVIPFSLVGALQFAPALRRRGARWHAVIGRMLVLCGFGTAISGMWMTVTYPWPQADGVAVYVMRLAVGTFMLASLALAVDAIRRRDFVAHGDWMTRAYAVAMGAGTQVLTHLPWFIFVGSPTEGPRAVMMGAAWAINLAVAERAIRAGSQRAAMARRAAMASRAAAAPVAGVHA